MIKCGVKIIIHSQTSTIAPLKFGNGYLFDVTLYQACDGLSISALKQKRVSKNGPRAQACGHDAFLAETIPRCWE